MDNKNILIFGAGIAGVTLTYWLKKYGFNLTIIEQSPKLREGGYAFDFFGSGFDVAEKMNLLPDLEKVDLKIQEVVFVDKNNTRKGGPDARKIRKLVNGRFYNIVRSDLSKVIYSPLDKNMEFIFRDTITEIAQNEVNANVTFKSGDVCSFDLVIGAGGLHSNVRNLIFVDESRFEKFFSFYVSSFTIQNYLKKNDSFLSYNIPNKQASIYSAGNQLTVVFIFSSYQNLSFDHRDVVKQKTILRNEYGSAGWECPSLLERMDTAPDFYFDSVSQIKMENWSKERVTLLGDAATCPSLLSGQSSSLAMLGAYVLAGELKESKGNYRIAFQNYENTLRPLTLNKQKLAQSFGGTLVPKSKLGIWLRNTFSNAMLSSFISKWFVKKYMTDTFELKNY